MQTHLHLAFALLAGSIITACATNRTAAPQQADMVLVNGNVVTVDEKQPLATAVAVSHGHIAAVGSDAEIAKWIGPQTQKIDLKGQTLVPGLIDAHLHLGAIGESAGGLDLADAKDEHAIGKMVAAKAQGLAKGKWIFGRGWNQTKWPGKAFPSIQTLNAAAPNNPVLLERVDGHAIWVNKKALDTVGFKSNAKDPQGGKIVRDSKGRPTGVLLDTASDLVYDKVPSPTLEESKANLVSGIKTVTQFGLTSVVDAAVGSDEMAALKSLAADHQLPLRVYVLVATSDKKLLDENLALGPQIGLYDDHLTIRGVKIFADGALGSRGAALESDYADDPGNKGLVRLAQEELNDLTARATKAGYQVGTHAIGDRANHMVLDAYEKAIKASPTHTPMRLRIEHAQILDPNDIPRFASLGVIASMQPTHCTSDMPWVIDRLGEKRAEEGAYAWQSLLKSGAIIASGSDAPVESSNPILGYYAAVTRQDTKGAPPGGWFPKQKMTRAQALRSFTLDAAFASFEENEKGSITPGKLADFTVLSQNIMTIPEPEILKTRATMTIIGGNIVWDAGQSKR